MNALLARRLVLGCRAEVEQLVRYSLNSRKILQLLYETKQYALLPTLLPIIRVGEEERSIIEKMYVDALRSHDKQTMETLFTLHKYDVNSLSRECGKHGGDPDLLTRGFDFHYYVQGIIEADDVDAFVNARTQHPWRWMGYNIVTDGRKQDVRRILARNYAPKIMDHLGYDNEKLICYLWPMPDTQHLFCKIFFEIGFCYFVSALQWTLDLGCRLDEQLWQLLKERRPEVYKACAQDV